MAPPAEKKWTMTQEHSNVWKVGELTERTSLSIHALHHYDEIGLLWPSGRTEAGHRRYRERTCCDCKVTQGRSSVWGNLQHIVPAPIALTFNCTTYCNRQFEIVLSARGSVVGKSE